MHFHEICSPTSHDVTYIYRLFCRWQPTRAPSPWKGVLQATSPGPVCPQKFPTIRNESEALLRMSRARMRYLQFLEPHLQRQSEDCLYLNLFAPKQDEGKFCVSQYISDDVHFGIGFDWKEASSSHSTCSPQSSTKSFLSESKALQIRQKVLLCEHTRNWPMEVLSEKEKVSIDRRANFRKTSWSWASMRFLDHSRHPRCANADG